MSSRNPTDWMWAQACELIDEAERMHRQFFRLAASGRDAARRGSRRSTCSRTSARSSSSSRCPACRPSAIEVDDRSRASSWCAPNAACRSPARGARCGGSRFPTAISSGASGCPTARLEAGTRELLDGCLILRLRKTGRRGRMNERRPSPTTTRSAPTRAHGVEAAAPRRRTGGRGRVAPAARGRADHRAGAQRRAVPRHGVAADRRPRALARRGAGGRAPAAPARRAAAEQARRRRARARTTCTGSAPPPTCCATSRRRTARTTRSARASSASACCSSSTAIRSLVARVELIDEPEQADPDIEGRALSLKAARGARSCSCCRRCPRSWCPRCRASRARRGSPTSSPG